MDYKIGDIKLNKLGYEYTILDITDGKTCTIKFKNSNYTCKVSISSVKNGTVRDPYQPTVYGVGIVGNKYKTHMKLNGVKKPRREYMIWRDMIRRCYDEKDHIRYPTYKDCTVSDNFKSYEYFYEWCQEQKGFGLPDWQLDKDLLIPGNKIYSEDTCCFLPWEINTALITWQNIKKETPVGVKKIGNKYQGSCYVTTKSRVTSILYDTAEEAFKFYKFIKEQRIHQLARDYKDLLDERAFEALNNFTVPFYNNKV